MLIKKLETDSFVEYVLVDDQGRWLTKPANLIQTKMFLDTYFYTGRSTSNNDLIKPFSDTLPN